jgi:hypothetical protein
MHPVQREVEQKKAEYLNKHKGLNKTFGVNADNFPQNVLNNIYKTIDRERNNYVITQYAKDKGFNPNKHVDLVENIAERGQVSYDMAQNSKYGSKLAPSLWARSAAGLQELGNAIVKQLPGEQGDVFKYKVPGLSKKERKQIADSKTGALESAAILNLPGQIIANQVAKYVKPIFGGTGADSRDQEDTPGVLSGQYIPGVDDKAATLNNPLTYMGLVSGLSNIGNIANATNSVLTTGANLTTKASQALAPVLGAEIAGVPGLTAGNALTAYGIANAGTNATGDIIEGNYGEAGYSAAKGLLTALPLTKFGNPELYPVLNNWRSALSFGTTGIDASLNPTAFNEFNAIRKAPNDWKSPLSLPSSAPTVFSKVTDKISQLGKIKKRGGELNKYEEEGMILDLSPEEIEEYKKGGYVIEDISVPSLSHRDEGGALNEFVDGGKNDKDKKKRKWLRGKQKGMYVSEDDPNLQRYDYLEGLDMTAEEFSEKYPGYSSTLQYIPEIKITGKKQSYWDRMMKNIGQKKLNNKIWDRKEKTFDEFRRDTELSNMHDVVDWATKPEEVKPKKIKKPTKQEVAAQKVFNEAFRVLTPGEIRINQRLKGNGLSVNSFVAESLGGRSFPIFDSKGEYASPEAQTYMEKKQNQEYMDRQFKNNFNDGALQGFHPEVLALAPGGLLTASAEVLTGISEIMAPYLGAEIAGISGATAGNALTAYGIANAGNNATGNIIKGNYWDAAYDAGKGVLTALPLTKWGNASLYPDLNNLRSALSFGTSGIDASFNPNLFNDFNAVRKAPNSYVAPISLPSSSPSVFSTVVGKLKKQKGGAIEKNMSKSEIKKLIAQGYVIEEI